MNGYHTRPYTNEDNQLVLDLLLDYRLATSVRTYPTLWRLRLLLSSRVWDPIHDAVLWTNVRGEISAFGMLWRRRPDDPNIILEYFFNPAVDDRKLLHQVVRWSRQRAQEIATEQHQPVKLNAGEHILDACDQVDFKGLGFVQSVRNGGPHTVMLLRSLGDPIPTIHCPDGYSLSSLDANSDLSGYEDLYSFTKVDLAFRQELLESDEYCHVVLSDSNGELTAFCEYSFSAAEWSRGAERLGWIDYVGTHEKQRGHGLGAFLLTVALESLKEKGAESVMLVSTSDNLPALGLYKKTGFLETESSLPFRYWLELGL